MKEDYLQINQKSWDSVVEEHYKSSMYDVDGFLGGKSSLNSIELELLGNIQGKKILHLQCHFGQDSISLARLGAEVTAIDFSEKAIAQAKKLAALSLQQVNFVCTDVYNLPQILQQKFDLIFTSYGVIGWLPDLNKWAKIINHFLKPKGQFVLAEFHPVVWMFDEAFEKIKYNYFNAAEIVEIYSGTYTNRQAKIETKYISWNHSLSEVFTALINEELKISEFREFDYSPYACFENTIEFEPNKFRIKHLENKIPMVYALKCYK